MMIEMPAKVLRAAALFVSKDEARRILGGVRIAWAEEHWDVAATDGCRLFNAWSSCQIEEPEDALVVDPLAFAGLKATDGAVHLDTEALTATVRRRKTGDVAWALSAIEGNFPNVQSLLGERTPVAPGHPGTFNAELLTGFCNAAKILAPKGKRTVRFGHPVKGERAAELRMMLIDWPGIRDEPFRARGVLMPVNLGRTDA